ncbi:efflux RND transporter periplasmic adaptor subunit [Peteryoungia desertarenae]|uniref:Efflux RND transporter periplasmic adaptor subunit n=1 Tax=Peteryoungia desertarenae TaxID=1813451 RepID=A0ABX6QQ96_9HYPH|nr:efflux RND transporter periplasmic adaptor subunit [Peteryoungia desertarenae]QLF70432.1 efflux RND transporter periplasmic adaptor subunit [Peteryoungia desertarenae]
MILQADQEKHDPLTSTEDLKALIGAPRARRFKWIRFFLGVCLVAAAGATYLYLGQDTTHVYRSEAAKRGDLTVSVTATGSVEPTVRVDVSSEQSGTVREVLVDFNSRVGKGDIVARLDNARFEADLKGAEAALLTARANVTKADADMLAAKARFERLQGLVTNRVSSEQELDSARFTYQAAQASKAAAEASVLSAQATLEQAKLNLSKTVIVSPIDGVILSRNVDPGATVAASLEAPTLFTIAGDLREMELQVSIDEADVGQVQVGQKAEFTVDAFPDQQFPAKITAIRYVSETVNDVVTYKGILAVRNDDLLLRQGMTATADIIVQSITDAILIPNAALRYTPPTLEIEEESSGFSLFGPPRTRSIAPPEPVGTERTVWLLRNDMPVAINIEIGASDGQNTVVVSGNIQEGDLLITDSSETGR